MTATKEEPRSPILEITTEEVPAKLFTIDGEEFELYSLDHLSPEQESSVTATYARSQRIVERLASAKNDQIAEKEAAKLRPLRVKLIGLMTSVPRDRANELHPRAQGKIMDAISEEIRGEEEEEDSDGDSDGE